MPTHPENRQEVANCKAGGGGYSPVWYSIILVLFFPGGGEGGVNLIPVYYYIDRIAYKIN